MLPCVTVPPMQCHFLFTFECHWNQETYLKKRPFPLHVCIYVLSFSLAVYQLVFPWFPATKANWIPSNTKRNARYHYLSRKHTQKINFAHRNFCFSWPMCDSNIVVACKHKRLRSRTAITFSVILFSSSSSKHQCFSYIPFILVLLIFSCTPPLLLPLFASLSVAYHTNNHRHHHKNENRGLRFR